MSEESYSGTCRRRIEVQAAMDERIFCHSVETSENRIGGRSESVLSGIQKSDIGVRAHPGDKIRIPEYTIEAIGIIIRHFDAVMGGPSGPSIGLFSGKNFSRGIQGFRSEFAKA
jgi:hypothetical protein